MKTPITITPDGNGNITIPDEMIKQLNWTCNTTLSVMLEGENIVIKEKTDWSIDEFHEHMETILNRVNETKTPHHLLHDGKVLVIAPYSTELEDLISNVK